MRPDQVCDILDVTRVLLSASSREGQPLSVLEALSRQCSVLLSDIPSHRPFAQHPGVALFARSDPQKAGTMLIRLLDEHTDRPRPDLACHKVEEHGRKLMTIYEEALRERAPDRAVRR